MRKHEIYVVRREIRKRRSRQSDNASARYPLMRANYTDQRRRMPIDHWLPPSRINIDTSTSRYLLGMLECPSVRRGRQLMYLYIPGSRKGPTGAANRGKRHAIVFPGSSGDKSVFRSLSEILRDFLAVYLYINIIQSKSIQVQIYKRHASVLKRNVSSCEIFLQVKFTRIISLYWLSLRAFQNAL